RGAEELAEPRRVRVDRLDAPEVAQALRVPRDLERRLTRALDELARPLRAAELADRDRALVEPDEQVAERMRELAGEVVGPARAPQGLVPFREPGERAGDLREVVRRAGVSQHEEDVRADHDVERDLLDDVRIERSLHEGVLPAGS